MGYADLGAFGGEIPTPHLDALAERSVVFTDFHASPNCAPTRASLLTGVEHHRTGLGTMPSTMTPNQRGAPGYEGHLNDRVATIAEVLQKAGFHTCMAGKWHLGHKERSQWPIGRGFERSFALLSGGASHWSDNTPLAPGMSPTYVEDDRKVEALPKDFYSTDAYAERMIEMIDAAGEAPFFGYLSFTAPHNPLHAPADAIRRFARRYEGGWDALRSERLDRLRARGLFPTDATSSPRPTWIKAWDTLSKEQRALRARDMASYAAMVHLMDAAIGRVVAHLKDSGRYDETLIVFLSDNGASRTTILDYVELGGEAADYMKRFDNRLENRGRPGSSTDLGPGWAYALNTPFRLFKGYVSQGGMQVPALFKPPRGAGSPGQRAGFCHVVDLVPTLLELTGVPHPGLEGGSRLHPLDGVSLLPRIKHSKPAAPKREMGFELYGMRGYREGQNKALRLPPPYGTGAWELFDLSVDPGEQRDLARVEPERLARLVEAWEAYARKYGIVEPDRPVAYAKPPREEAW